MRRLTERDLNRALLARQLLLKRGRTHLPRALERMGGLQAQYAISPKTPQSTATFLVDGAVAGTWRYEKGRVRVERVRRLDARTRRELSHEAERLAALHA